jgi:hypothetical protein
MPKRLIRKWFSGPGTRGRDASIDQVRPAKQVDEAIAGGEIEAGLRFGLGHAGFGHRGDGHAGSSNEAQASSVRATAPCRKIGWQSNLIRLPIPSKSAPNER